MYTRYMVVSAATQQVVARTRRRAGWDGADTEALALQRKHGGVFYVVRIMATAEAAIFPNRDDIVGRLGKRR